MPVDVTPRGRGMPKKMWMEVVAIDLKKYKLCEYLTRDRSKGKYRNHVADPSIVGAGLS